MSDEPKEEKKIIVDEDWKNQVRAEKEKTGEQPPREQEAAEAQAEEPWPAPSFPLLITTLATQAMVAMGMIPHPATQKADVQLGQAKHFIDMISMLEEKTERNRTEEESAMMEQITHELRVSFLAIEKQQQGTD